MYEFHLPKTALYRTIGSSTLTAPSAVALNAFKSHLWATDLCCGGMRHVFGFKVPGEFATDELNIRPEALGYRASRHTRRRAKALSQPKSDVVAGAQSNPGKGDPEG
jgi:hypothetical protein